MTELCIVDKHGTELGHVMSRESKWWMDDDGILWNDEDIRVVITTAGIVHRCELRGKDAIRSIGEFGDNFSVEIGNTVHIAPRNLRMRFAPAYERI